MRLVSRFILLIGLILTVIAILQIQASTPRDIFVENNGLLLKGLFFQCEGEGPLPTVILLNGFPGGEKDIFGLGEKISDDGFNVLIFNWSGTYQSQGQVSLGNAQKDIQAAFDFLHRQENTAKYRIDTDDIFLGGWCYGGGMALSYAASHPEITAVFSIAGNDHGEFFKEYSRNSDFAKMVDEIFTSLKAPVGPVRFAKGALPKEIVEVGIDMLNSIFDLRKSAPSLAPKDILLIGGWDDRQVTIDQFVLPFYRALEKADAKKVKIVAFQDDHYFKNSREELTRTIIEWLKTRLEKNQSTEGH